MDWSSSIGKIGKTTKHNNNNSNSNICTIIIVTVFLRGVTNFAAVSSRLTTHESWATALPSARHQMRWHFFRGNVVGYELSVCSIYRERTLLCGLVNCDFMIFRDRANPILIIITHRQLNIANSRAGTLALSGSH